LMFSMHSAGIQTDDNHNSYTNGVPYYMKRQILMMILVTACFAINAAELPIIDGVALPLQSFANRRSCFELEKKVLDGFGAYRTAGHKHAGLDIRASFSEPVMSIGKGIVRAIYGEFPYRTVLIEHTTRNGGLLYSAYTHIEQINVYVGQQVDEKTVVGRVFNEEEYRKSGFYENHLHFEIRKTMDRYKGISIKCFTEEELDRYFYNPLLFFEGSFGNKK